MAEEQPPGTEQPSPSEGSDAAAAHQSSAEEQPPGQEQPPGTEQPSPAEGSDAAGNGAAAQPRILRRSSTDKVIAGVAGGIGAYFGIDAVIVRIAFIVLTFMGGAGPFLYLIGWLALPTEHSRSIVAKALGGDSPHRLRNLLAVGLIALGLLITANLSSGLFGLFVDVWSIAPYLALILIAAGVILVLWPGPDRRPKPTPARPPAPAYPATPPPTAYPMPAPPSPTAAGPEWSPPAERRRRGRSMIGTLTVAILLVYAGGAVTLERLDTFEVDVGVFFAGAVAITGVGLLVSAFAAPARGLILLGVLLSAPMMLFVGADVPWGSGIGEVRVSVTDVEELEDEYRHGIGKMIVDLRNLDPDSTDHSLDLSLSVGEMLVYVPDTISTAADINVGAGTIRSYGEPPPGHRMWDLFDVRNLLEEFWTWTLPDLDARDGIDLDDIDLDDLDSYSAAYERRHGHRIGPGRLRSLARLLADEPGLEGADFRDKMEGLIREARGVVYPSEVREEGLGIGRKIAVPVWGEPQGELRLNIDVGIGKAEVATASAPSQ